MTERITKETLNERVRNVNRRLNPGLSPMEYGSRGRYVLTNGRNGHTALDEYEGTTALRTITVGTKREIADFLHAMMVGIDLANVEAESVLDDARADAQAFFGTPAETLGVHQLVEALGVLVFDPKIRAHLDPRALAQARAALGLEQA